LIVGVAVYVWTAVPASVSAPQPFAIFAQESRALVTEKERQLEAQLRELEQEIAGLDQNIQQRRQEARSLQRDLSLLERQIQKLNLQISATNLQIRRISARIESTQSAIYESQLRIARQKAHLGNTLRAINEADKVPLLEIVLAHNSIVDFFADLNAIYALQLRAQVELDQMYAMKRVLEEQEAALSEAKEEQVALSLVQTAQREDATATRRARTQLLAVTRGEEARYQQMMRQAQRTAAEIRAQLFRLRDGGELSFGEAYELAKIAGDLTGVRPALILAVLTQESALGRNVGQCRLADLTSGATVHVRNGRVFNRGIHRTRDLPRFIEITRGLGLDPLQTRVSCPILQDGPHGGAMGVAQFLPSTWARHQDRIGQLIGRTPSPWANKDSFVAAALYLAQNGATQHAFEAERRAAARYYAGGRWQLFLRSYGDRVMRLAERFQGQINVLEGRN
jgi:peptidoglycan hydrolase CwlO-like protein